MFKAYNKQLPAYFLSMFSTTQRAPLGLQHASSIPLSHHVPQNTLLKITIRISGPLLWKALYPTIKESATV